MIRAREIKRGNEGGRVTFSIILKCYIKHKFIKKNLKIKEKAIKTRETKKVRNVRTILSNPKTDKNNTHKNNLI